MADRIRTGLPFPTSDVFSHRVDFGPYRHGKKRGFLETIGTMAVRFHRCVTGPGSLAGHRCASEGCPAVDSRTRHVCAAVRTGEDCRSIDDVLVGGSEPP